MPATMIPGWKCAKENCKNHTIPWNPNKLQWKRDFIKCPDCNHVEIIPAEDKAKYMEMMT